MMERSVAASRAANIRSIWPFASAVLLCFGILAVLSAAALRACEGHFGYPLDDTYIHMAMAKNFVMHGVWGITRYEFSSSTSSPFYTLLLAVCYRIFGIREITPLILNGVAAIALLRWCDFLLRCQDVPARLRGGVLAGLVLAIPLPTLVMVGMEHVFHTLLTLIFLHLCADALANRRPLIASQWTALLACTVMLAGFRYEAVFVIGIAGLLFLLQKRWRETAALAVAGAAPLVVYGWISVRHGWYAIPNSLLLKANAPTVRSNALFGGFGKTLRDNVYFGFHIVVLIAIAALLLIVIYRRRASAFRYGTFRYETSFLTMFAVSALLHFAFARMGWFYRYESYLVAAGILAVLFAWRETGRPASQAMAAAGYALAGLLLCSCAFRTYHAFSRAALAVSDIYDQQYQMGLFARDNLAGKALVLNDIGAVSFLSDARVLDLIGLGSLAPLQARLEHRYSAAWLAAWSRREHVAAAITYPWFAAPEWHKAGKWTVPGNYMSASDSVEFFNADPAFALPLQDALRRFDSTLPKRVVAEP